MKLRKMRMSDAELMLEWKNYPETRKFAIVSHAKIARDDHFAWLQNNLKYFKIIEDTGVECGAIRVQDKEISIWIDRVLWGLGYAHETINQVARKGYTAKIVDGNIASFRLFIGCGFVPIEHKKNYYILRK